MKAILIIGMAIIIVLTLVGSVAAFSWNTQTNSKVINYINNKNVTLNGQRLLVKSIDSYTYDKGNLHFIVHFTTMDNKSMILISDVGRIQAVMGTLK